MALGLSSVNIEQTFCRGEDSAGAVALDGSAFEFEIEAIVIVPLQHSLAVEFGVNGIVVLCLKLSAPSVESEIEQMPSVGILDGDESVVACPGVVGLGFDDADVLQYICRQPLFQQLLKVFRFRCDDE